MTDRTEIAPITIRGRVFTLADLCVIESVVDEHYERGRTHISEVVCERLDWRQPNGWLKDRACRDVLRRLESVGMIDLPPPLVRHRKTGRGDSSPNKRDLLRQYNLETSITTFPNDLELVFAKGNEDELLWNQLTDEYHYLGHDVIVGRCIKYVIKSSGRLLGAIAFASPAWMLEPRDRILDGLGIDRPRDYTINNTRFLLLPNVQVKNLASHVLAVATRRVVEDWRDYYALTPLVAETFVQPSRFEGTCYLAANWLEIGYTGGYAKHGPSHRNSQEPKKILLYGLNSKIRHQLQAIVKENRL